MRKTRSSRSGPPYATALLVVLGLAWFSPSPASAQLNSLVVTMSSPSSGSTVGGTIPVEADVAIVGFLTVRGVQFTLDGVPLGAEDTTRPYAISWDTRTASNGTHTVTAVARDLLGVAWNADPVTVTVFNDTTPPAVAITSPASGGVSGTIGVNATASDNVGVVGVQFRLDGVNLGAEDTTSPYGVSWNTATASSGAHTLTAVARDAAGNTATSVGIAVSVDNLAPVVAITAPSGGVVGGTTSVSASASDNVGVVGVQFRLDGVNLGTEDTTSPYGVSWNTATASNGSHTLTAVARDASGNTATSAGVTVTVDNLPPTVAITAPTGGTVSGTTIVSANASDNVGVAGVQFRLDGANLGAEDTTSPYSVSWDTTTASSGSHSLSAVARDARGNTTTSAAVTVTVSNDATPPSVSITAPASGSTVAGTTVVSANASDNVGVTGVQFFVDGVALGAADTTAPYTVSWDTTTVAAGAHTVSAVASDGAGNTATASAPVTVSQTATRFEDTDLSITYTDGTTAPAQPAGWWHGSRSRAWSAKIASFNRSQGARARFRFTGTTVRWIGFRSPWAGIGRVYVDDVFVSELDLYATTEQVQAVVYSTTGLTNGVHTLTVESTGQKNPASADYAVVVDAFEVSPASPPPVVGTRVEETGLSLSAGWTTDAQPVRGWSGGTATTSATTGAQATLGFVGTEVRWVGLRGPQTGIARVYLDGSFDAEVDTYAPTETQAVVYTTTGLAAGRHTLRIDVTGARNAASTGSFIVVDAVDTRGRLEDQEPVNVFTGDWRRDNFDKDWSGSSPNEGSGSTALSRTAGVRATVSFNGTQASWIGLRSPATGIARVLVDGAYVADVDTYAPAEDIQAVLYTASGLADGPHTMTVEVTGQRSPSGIDSLIIVDAFDARFSTSAPQITRFQETDPSTTYTGAWTQGTRLNFWAGETAAYTAAAGARAAFTFTGTAVRWIGQRSFYGGIARVLLDGVEVAQVDTFATIQEEFHAPMYSVTGLTAGTHTLTIENTGQKAPLSQNTWVIVDAFDVY
jgi:hypothetical protein